MCKTLTDLKKQLQNTALDQASEIFRSNDDQDLLANLKEAGSLGDLDRMEEHSGKFSEHSEQLQEVGYSTPEQELLLKQNENYIVYP